MLLLTKFDRFLPLIGLLALTSLAKEKVWRVHGGVAKEFKDSKGRVWQSDQSKYNGQTWGGWIKLQPRMAFVGNLTKEAEKKAKKAGYDNELFHSVCWAKFPDTVKVDLNTGNGKFQVAYMVGEHWPPNNRSYDIFIEKKCAATLCYAG